MGLLPRHFGRNKATNAAEGRCRPDTLSDDQLLLQLREFQARVAEISAGLAEARALLRELGRRYPNTS